MQDVNQLVQVLINIGIIALAILIVTPVYHWLRNRKEKKQCEK